MASSKVIFFLFVVFTVMSVISAGEDAANKEIDMETAATKHGYFGGYYGGYGHPYGFGYRPFSFTGYHPHSFGYGFFG